ncbi:MAG: carbohydrate-binding protein, partial [Fibrobacter sp.]|nr:carbohydrate-binding protein [Fibrobacter sp.]
STTAVGPWTYKGQIMGTQPNGVSNTIHPGMIDFGGNSYFFYHNAKLPGGGSYKRSVCVEQFEYNKDGTIPPIPETQGGVVTGVTALNPYDTVQAETICWSSGVRTAICSDGGIMIDSIHNQDYIKVEGVDFGTGAESFDARVASSASSGKIELHLDSLNGTKIGSCDIASTGGPQNWTIRNCTVSGATGKHDLFLKFTGGNGLLFTFNWWKFNPVKVGIGSAVRNSWNAFTIVSNIGKIIAADIKVPSSQAKGNIEVALFDLSGRLVTVQGLGLPGDNKRFTTDFSKVKPGNYVMKVTAGGRSILTEKVLCTVK